MAPALDAVDFPGLHFGSTGNMSKNRKSAWPWYPLSIWTVLLVFFITNILCMVIVVALREGLGLGIPLAAAGGGGAVAALLIIGGMVRKRKEADDQGS
jgi:hypothetical protein